MNGTMLQNLADSYFSTLNPIAKKISIDIATTKDAYEDLWSTLSYKEQNKIIDETIIHPEVVLRYSFCAQCDEKVKCFYSSLRVGEKFGELPCHDEHSAPFSWMTTSQLDLNVFCDQEVYTCAEVLTTVSDDQKIVKLLSSKESFIDPPRIVLGGSTSNFSNITSFENKYMLKSRRNEEQTLFHKLKTTAAIIKSQTIKSALNKAGIESSQKKSVGYESDILLKSRNKCTVVTSSKISKPVISKPKSPPPPPPSKSPPPTPSKSPPLPTTKSPLHPPSKPKSLAENSRNYSETKALLPGTSHVSSINLCTKASVKLSELESFETHQTDNFFQPADFSVPKTGFDFLDNW